MSYTVTVETPDGPVSVTRLEFGVKSVIDAICAVVGLYDRHRENVITDLPPEIVAALDVLSDGCAALRLLNIPGPA